MSLANTVIASLLVQVDGDSTGAYRALQQIDSAFLGTTDKANVFAQGILGTTALVGTGLAVLGAGALKLAVDYESSFAGIKKTVVATKPEFDALGDSMRKLATEIPVSVNELNRIGEAAGQLGVEAPNILEFSRVMAELGATTNLSSLEAAEGLARFANITQYPIENIEALGSVIVELGNTFAANEQEILNYGLRIAGAGDIAGLTEPQILAIGTAMASVGVQAEAGGTAIQKTLLKIVAAVAEGGGKLQNFATVAGLSAAQFKDLWEVNAGEAFNRFIEGIGKGGKDAILSLGDLELQNERTARALLSLGNAGSLLREAMADANAEMENGTALADEFAKRQATAAAELKVLGNNIQDVGITLGNFLLPKFVEFIKYARENVPQAAAWMQDNWVPALENVAMAFGAVLQPIYILGEALAQNEGAISTLGQAAIYATAAIVALGAAMLAAAIITNPWVVAYLGAIALSAAIITLIENWDDVEQATSDVVEGFGIMGDAVADLVSSIWDAAESVNDGLLSAYADAVNASIELPAEILDGWGDAVDAFYEAGVDWIQGLWDGAVDRAEDFFGWIGDLPSRIVEQIKDAADGHSPWGIAKSLGEDLVGGIRWGVDAAFPGLTADISNKVNALVSTIRQTIAFALSPTSGEALPIGEWDKTLGIYGPEVPIEGPFLGITGHGMTAAEIRDANAYARDYIRQHGLDTTYGGSGYSLGGGGSSGGGSSGAGSAAKDAAAVFADAWNSELQSGELAKAFGETGGALLDKFYEALDNPSSAKGLGTALTKMIDDAKEEGVPNAEELGAALADAIGNGLSTGSAEAVQEALLNFNAAVTKAGTLTVDNLANALGTRASDRAIQERIGSAGVKLMDALGTALDEGGKKNIDKLADQMDGLMQKLSDKAVPAQGAYLGTALMTAMNDAIAGGGEEATRTLGDVLSQINQILLGGALDIRTGTVLAADAVGELAQAFGVHKDTIIENIGIIVDSGLAGLVGSLDNLPKAAQTAIAALLEVLEKGSFDADTIIKGIGANVPGWKPGDPSGSGSTSEVLPGETIAELVARLTGKDILGGQASLFDQNGFQLSPGDIYSAVTSGKFVKDWFYGRYTVGPNPQQGGHVTNSGFVPNEPYTGSHASGLLSVPYDGYIAQLHRKERVLTADEAERYNNGGVTMTVTVPVTVYGDADPDKIAKAVKETIEKELTTVAVQFGKVSY